MNKNIVIISLMVLLISLRLHIKNKENDEEKPQTYGDIYL